jgi:hypothetical protein
MQKMHFVTHGAHRQGKQAYRVDIDFRNAFNTMSQTALWHVINMFHIPDVDLLEQIYDSATVRLAPNDAENATITFHTGIAQGSITIPQLFKILINALLRRLTATGQNQGINKKMLKRFMAVYNIITSMSRVGFCSVFCKSQTPQKKWWK